MSETLTIRPIESLAPPDLHLAMWNETGRGQCWYFGNASGTGEGVPFWKMDLDDNAVAVRLWRHARPLCEQHLGCGLRVLRQYANGHTYGQGGQVHQDDYKPGRYTLLYYPMLEWQSAWEGETVFHDGTEEVVAAVRPAPNRAVLFDARIPHVGRAPSRQCPFLRVTVAYKLSSAGATGSA